VTSCYYAFWLKEDEIAWFWGLYSDTVAGYGGVFWIYFMTQLSNGFSIYGDSAVEY
jgi:hypothetical protein